MPSFSFVTVTTGFRIYGASNVVTEMVADHAAMSQELGDSLIDFEKNVTFKKFEWSEIDKDFILRVASLFHK